MPTLEREGKRPRARLSAGLRRSFQPYPAENIGVSKVKGLGPTKPREGKEEEPQATEKESYNVSYERCGGPQN